MAGKVDEVKGAEIAGDLDEVHGARTAGENGDVIDIGAGEVEPKVGHGMVGLGGLAGGGVGIDQVLPSIGVEGGDEHGHRLRGVEGRLCEAVGVDGDGGEAGEDATGFGVVADHALRRLKHGAVEGKGGVRRGLVGEGGDLLGDGGEGRRTDRRLLGGKRKRGEQQEGGGGERGVGFRHRCGLWELDTGCERKSHLEGKPRRGPLPLWGCFPAKLAGMTELQPGVRRRLVVQKRSTQNSQTQ